MPRPNRIGLPHSIAEKHTATSGRRVGKQTSKREKEADVGIEIKAEPGLRQNNIQQLQAPNGSLTEGSSVGVSRQSLGHDVVGHLAIEDPRAGEGFGQLLPILWSQRAILMDHQLNRIRRQPHHRIEAVDRQANIPMTEKRAE